MTTFEKTGALAVGTNLSGVAAGAAATAMIGVGVQMIVQPAGPEPGYHPAYDHHDLVGGGIMVGIGAAALYAMFRAVWRN